MCFWLMTPYIFLTVLTQANSGECQAHPRQMGRGGGGGKITEKETESGAQRMSRLNQCAKQAAQAIVNTHNLRQ